MKKILKIAIGVGALIVAGVVVVKIIKEESKKLDNEEKKINKEFEDLGLSKEKVKEEFNKEEDKDNYVKAIYHSIMFGSVDNECLDRDLLKVCSDYKNGKSLRNGALDNENVIHVMQSDTPKGEKLLDFYFEIPEFTYKQGTFKYPKLKDFIRNIRLAALYMSSNIIRYTPMPVWELIGYYVISYKIKGRIDPKTKEPIVYQKQIRIPKKDYEKYADDKHDGLFNYIKDIYRKIVNDEERRPIEISLYDPDLKEGEEIYDWKFIIPVLMFKVSFPIATYNGPEAIGINIKTAIKCLKYLTEELVISQDSGRGRLGGASHTEIRYEHIMFHSKNYKYPEEGFDFMKYYTIAKVKDKENPDLQKEEIISDSYTYEQ